MELEQQIQLTVSEVAYRSPDGRFAVLIGHRSEDPDQEVTAVGNLADVSEGELLQLHGRFQRHPTYGERFAATSFVPITPSTPAGIAKYLGSGMIPGVGPALAGRIVERFGDQTLQIIATQSARLREISGVGAQRASRIAEAVRARAEEAHTLAFLHGLGLGPAVARKIRQRYGTRTVEAVRNDPYELAGRVASVGFRTADSIGLALGFARDDPRRAAGAVLHLLGKAADEGHTFLSRAALSHQARALGVPFARIAPAIDELAHSELVVLEHDAVYAPPLYRAEVRVADMLRVRRAQPPDPIDVEALLARVLPRLGNAFAAAQLDAVRASLAHSLLVLTGGPGTGKTTTVKAIVAAHVAVKHTVKLCSPTGRAAKRLADATGHEALTIHRLLEYNPMTGEFARNRENPLTADLLLVDEASMLDVQLAEQLLSALPRSAALVLVGDVDQLPPISPGPVLRALIDSGACPVVRLTEVFRQAQRSAIVRSAHAILRGHGPVVTQPQERGRGDMYVVRANRPEQIVERLLASLHRVRDRYDLDPGRDVQILTPMRKGLLGTDRLNQVLQDHLNPLREPVPGPPAAYRPGDKVMQLRNDYTREVFNGDLGEVRRVESGIVFVDMGGREVAYERDAQRHIALAYASTVHKVQGSEFPAVIVLLHGSHRMLLHRALVYTAITRAKTLTLIIGDERALKLAIDNTRQAQTHSSLRKRLEHPTAQRP